MTITTYAKNKGNDDDNKRDIYLDDGYDMYRYIASDGDYYSDYDEGDDDDDDYEDDVHRW